MYHLKGGENKEYPANHNYRIIDTFTYNGKSLRNLRFYGNVGSLWR
jgi:hypothetical protein